VLRPNWVLESVKCSEFKAPLLNVLTREVI